MSTVPIFPPPAPTGPSNFSEEHTALSITAWQGPVGSAIRASMSIPWDNEADLAVLAIKARFPDFAPPDALPWLAADRLVDVGPNETKAHIIVRLIRWLESARYFGTPTGILTAISGYLSPLTPAMRVINQSGNWYTYTVGTDPWPVGQALPSAPSRTVATSSYWKWDGLSDPWIGSRGWWRSWVVIYSPSGSPWPAPSATCGGGARCGDGTACNWAGSQNDMQMLRNLTRKFKAAHTYVPTIIVSYVTTLFPASSGTPGTNLPDGFWGHWGKVGGFGGLSSVYVPARNIAGASYIDGVA
jgi:hypothetical protein